MVTRDREEADRLLAATCEAGLAGAEELGDGSVLVLYAARADAARLRRTALACVGDAARVGEIEDVEPVDWAEHWKQGLEAIRISSRLAIRPSFVAPLRGYRGHQLVIDPGQAFGTGTHASTRLALEWIDRVVPGLPAGARVLDVGTGSGVLAFACLALGARWVLGFDTDARAVTEAEQTRRRNDLPGTCRLVCAGIEAIAETPFELIVANLLRSEFEPLIGELARRLGPSGSGQLILSGLLLEEHDRVAQALAAHGLAIRSQRSLEQNGDSWLGLLTQPA